MKDFDELDDKVESRRAKYWGGRDLPFPVLLDATGKTVERWGVRAFPTTVLIDPDGNVVGEVSHEDLEEKLPPLPMSERVAKGLDRSIYATIDGTLGRACSWLSTLARVPIRLDAEDLKAAGITPDTPVSETTMANRSHSLRSWLDLVLEADGLAYQHDDKGLVVRRRKPGAPPPEPSAVQRAAARRLEKVLGERISFDFKDKPLGEVAKLIGRAVGEDFVLSLRDRRAGRLDPKTPVSGSANGLPLREALTKLLGPLGVDFTVRDEAIVLTAKAAPGR